MTRNFIKKSKLQKYDHGFYTFKYLNDGQIYYNKFKQHQFFVDLIQKPYYLNVVLDTLAEIEEEIQK